MTQPTSNSHSRWLAIMYGMTNKHDKLLGKGWNKGYIKDISNDEAILVKKKGE